MNDKILSTYGVGPIYVVSILILTIIGLILNQFNVGIKVDYLNKVLIFLGIILIILGLVLWISAVMFSKIKRKITEGKLITTGVYSVVRNPIYSAFLFIFTGILLFTNNLYLLIFPIFFYLLLTFLLKRTEEKWLIEKFKDEYKIYLKKVNRVIPNIFKYKNK